MGVLGNPWSRMDTRWVGVRSSLFQKRSLHAHHHFAFWGRKMEVETKQKIGRKQSRRIHKNVRFFQMTRQPREVPPCSQPCGSFSPHSRLSSCSSAAEGRS